MKFKDSLEDLEKEYGKPDILRAIKKGPVFKREIMRELFNVANETKPRLKDKLISAEIYICPNPAGEYFGEEWRIEIKLKEDYLKTLEREDFINKFGILIKETLNDVPDEIVVAKVQFNPKRFLEKMATSKISNLRGNFPKFDKRGKYYFLVLGKNRKDIKIPGKNPNILIRYLVKKSGALSLAVVFDEMVTKNQRHKPKAKIDPIANAVKEIQRAINSKWTLNFWLDNKIHPRVVNFHFEKKKKAQSVEPE